jgi:hypothetical protein
MGDLHRQKMEMESIKSMEKDCKKLVGKTIANVRYLTEKEMEANGWYSKAPVIIFTDGTYLYPSCDDEGNDAGALFTNIKGLDVIPRI